MSTPSPLFDTALLRRRLRRAVTGGYADFLVGRVAEDLDDRLATVLREFKTVLDLATPGRSAAAVLTERYPQARHLRLALLPEVVAGTVVGDPEALPSRRPPSTSRCPSSPSRR